MFKKTKIFLCLFFIIFNMTLLNAKEESIKEVTFFVDNYKPVIIKLLHYKEREDIKKGLMFKEKVEPYDGLILEFNDNELARVWMKNMKIPIDIIFLSKDGRVLGSIEDEPICQENQNCSITTVRGAKYIVEVKAGFIKENYINYSNMSSIKDIK